MRFYRISIDFGSNLDLKGKIAASLLIRKMIERLGNEYEIKVNTVQDTHCEMILKDNSDRDLSEQLRGELAGMAGNLECRIRVELEGGSSGTAVGGGAPSVPQTAEESIQAEFERRRSQSSFDAGGSTETSENTALTQIHSLVGAEEFKILADELSRMAPQLRALKNHSYLQRNTYLFSIDDGYGLTTALKLFAQLLKENKLISDKDAVEFRLPNLDDPDDIAKLESNLRSELPKLEGCVVCMDLSACQSNLDKSGYRSLLRAVSSITTGVLVFRIPYLEQKALQNIVNILDDVFFLRTVTFVPMDFEDLSECAARAAQRYGFSLDPSVEPVLAQLMAHDKSDGRFYGIKSAEKIVDKMVYEKLRLTPAGGTSDTVITAVDLKELDQEFDDMQDLSGEEKLKQLIGMEPVAKQLTEIVSLIEYAIKNSSASSRPSIHMRFVGNPGTGKTTVARILGQMLKERGILRKGVFFEYEGVDLIAKYVGHTAPKTAQICRDAYGSVLFIDEAYALAVKDNAGGTASFNSEALNTLLSEMENHRDDMVVIMAGYKDEIDELMRSNPGLVQRMPYEIEFPNYTREQLSEIFFAQARKDFLFGEEFIEKVREYFRNLPNNIYLSPTFANARFVRNLFERTWSKAVMRAQLEKATLTTLLPIDFEKAAEEMDAAANGAMVFGKDASGATLFAEEEAKIKFDDVRGEDEAKELLMEVVDFLKNPAKFQSIGARVPKGCLLYGPPGTGKTMLAKAVAGEAGVPVLTINGSDLVQKFVGEGAEKVRGLFQKARKLAPCIVFIDEIDAVGTSRNGSASSDSTLIQLLTELDGFSDKTEIIVLAATNRPEMLDPALRRPGRFDRDVPVELPDLTGRIDILNHYLAKVEHEEDIDVNEVARLAAGSSGAELRNIVNEAALLALRQGRSKVAQKDLEESIDITSVGYVKKNSIMSEQEKWITCYHEIGHALAAALQTHSAPVQKITVLPRTSGVLGFAQQLETSEPVLYTRTQLENRIVTICAGRAAEEVHFHEVTTGASNDIEKATSMARSIVARLGMTDEFDMVCLQRTQGGYLGGGVSEQCSEATARAVDEKVIEIVRTQHRRAFDLLKANEAKLDELAKYLFEKETITGDEFMAILEK